MKTFVYIRVSTDKQTFDEQMHTIKEYIKVKGLTIDEIVSDSGISGTISYKERKLNDLVNEMNEGDALVVSEISRLGRSMSDLNKLVNDELKPRKLRLIVISMGIDLDCANLKAIDEMILFAFSFSSQMERELISERTRAALKAKKERGELTGGACRRDFSDMNKAVEASKNSRREKAKKNPANMAFWEFISDYQKIYGRLTANSDFQPVSDELNRRGKTTSSGLEFTKLRARAMFYSLQKIYA